MLLCALRYGPAKKKANTSAGEKVIDKIACYIVDISDKDENLAPGNDQK